MGQVAEHEGGGDDGEDAEHGVHVVQAGGAGGGLQAGLAAGGATPALEGEQGAGDAAVQHNQGDQDGQVGQHQQDLQHVVQACPLLLLAGATDVHLHHLVSCVGDGGSCRLSGQWCRVGGFSLLQHLAADVLVGKSVCRWLEAVAWL